MSPATRTRTPPAPADSQTILFSSNRNGSYDIFKQSIEERQAEAVITGPGDQVDAGPSADGAWPNVSTPRDSEKAIAWPR